MERIIVRRGRFLTYELLRRTFGGDPNVEIVWDRRRAPSAPSESPVSDRRGRPPEQWFRLDYLFTTGAKRSLQPPAPDDQSVGHADEPPTES
jgi:hypothetical protein